MSRKPTVDSRIRINRDTLNGDTGSRHRTWLKRYPQQSGMTRVNM